MIASWKEISLSQRGGVCACVCSTIRGQSFENKILLVTLDNRRRHYNNNGVQQCHPGGVHVQSSRLGPEQQAHDRHVDHVGRGPQTTRPNHRGRHQTAHFPGFTFLFFYVYCVINIFSSSPRISTLVRNPR